MRRVLLAVAVAAAMLTYLSLMLHFAISDHQGEAHFGASRARAELRVYIEPVEISALNESMLVRVTATRLPEGTNEPAGNDLVLLLSHDAGRQKIEITASRPDVVTTMVLNFRTGDVVDYPFDLYRSRIQVEVFTAAATSSGAPLRVPAQVVVWQGILGFAVDNGILEPTQELVTNIFFEIRRTHAVILFALAAYGAMIVLGVGSAASAMLVFSGVRAIESTMMGALAAIVFALPALRNALPGTPPLGVKADLLVFLWTEIAAVVGVGLFIIAWMRSGPRPR